VIGVGQCRLGARSAFGSSLDSIIGSLSPFTLLGANMCRARVRDDSTGHHVTTGSSNWT
jgi:hypothetical protein